MVQVGRTRSCRSIPLYFLMFVAFLFSSCATPVIRPDLMEGAVLNPLMSDFVHDPDQMRGGLFILGGIIVSTRYTDEGSMIEAVHVPVSSHGYLAAPAPSARRCLLIYPNEKGKLDPAVYSKDKGITVAGVFIENRIGFIDEVSYVYPTFLIEDIYLWEHGKYASYRHPSIFFSIGGFFSDRHWGVGPSVNWGW